MINRPYDITSPQSLKNYSLVLRDKSLGDVVGYEKMRDDAKNKGKLGSLVEEYFFEYKPGANRNHDPDFEQAGVELKVTGVVHNSRQQPGEAPYKAKERLVLTMINYRDIVHEQWSTSSLMKKCSLMLILFYLYQKGIPASQLRFVMDPLLWEFPAEDLEIIRKDWVTIQEKVNKGLAHELSEGDTFYLGACRKGAGGLFEKLKAQPESDIMAKARAFSLKPSYVNTMINRHARETGIISTKQDAERGIEELTLERFKGLQGLTVEDIATRYDCPVTEAKSHLAMLSMRILGSKKRNLPEFEKAGIVLKTMRLQQNGTPKESVSFPTFDFIETANQQWEESVFYEKINQRFFFVIYRFDENGTLRFEKAMFWNMPYQDREIAHDVWRRTVRCIRAGDMSGLPKIKDRQVAHVRPHGKNKADTLPLPNGGEYTKQCFWLNSLYLAEQINIR